MHTCDIGAGMQVGKAEGAGTPRSHARMPSEALPWQEAKGASQDAYGMTDGEIAHAGKGSQREASTGAGGARGREAATVAI